VQVFTYADRPDLVERVSEIDEVWPEFLHHADVPLLHWANLRDELPEFQIVLFDDERDTVVGRGQTMPASERDGLPGGIDDMLERRWGGGPPVEPDVLSAMVAIVDPRRQGEGLSALVVEGMRRVAREAGFTALIAPVRPTRKAEFPLIDLERYVRWTREDGLAWDPWIRLHARLGAELVEVCPASMTVTGSREEWVGWTGLEFPDEGDYVVPGALVPVAFDGDTGRYVEPNVWMRHAVEA
jgi:GNAT superfamily N-acetyltransferase